MPCALMNPHMVLLWNGTQDSFPSHFCPSYMNSGPNKVLVFLNLVYIGNTFFLFYFFKFFLHSNVAELCSTVIVVFSSILRLYNDFLWAREQISPESVGLSTTIDVGFCK